VRIPRSAIQSPESNGWACIAPPQVEHQVNVDRAHQFEPQSIILFTSCSSLMYIAYYDTFRCDQAPTASFREPLSSMKQVPSTTASVPTGAPPELCNDLGIGSGDAMAAVAFAARTALLGAGR
jgi:hypothetical protein